jgi:hypothetical protein
MGWLEQRKLKQQREEERKERQSAELKEAWRGVREALPGALREFHETFDNARQEFYGRNWSAEEARRELGKIRRALQHKDDLFGGAEGTAGNALRELIHGFVVRSPESGYTVLPKAELESMADFLEHRITATKKMTEQSEHDAKAAQYKSRRLVDAQISFYEDVGHKSLSRVEGLKLHKKRRLEILGDESLSPDEKGDELEREERDFRRWLKKHGFSVFEDED